MTAAHFDDDDGFSGNRPCELVYPPAPPNANKIWDERVAKTMFAPQRKAPPTRPLAAVEVAAGQRQAYAQSALQNELRALNDAVEGQRNHRLFVSAAALRRFVREGDLVESQVEGLLTQTARQIGLTDKEIEKTIASARRKDDASGTPVVLRNSDDWTGPVYQLEIADDPLQGIGFDRMRFVRTAITAHIDRTGGDPRRCNRADLVSPAVPAFRKAVDHDDQRSFALDCTAQACVARIDRPHFTHSVSPVEI